MLTSITPLGERSRGMSWLITVVWFTIASVLGGAAIGGAFGVAGAELPRSAMGPLLLVTSFGAIAGSLADARRFGLHVPTLKRQVNDQWLYRYRGWAYGTGFGFQLGVGVVTVVNTSLVYVMLLLCALTASVTDGALVGGVSGVVRALILLQVADVRTFADLVVVDRRQERWEAAGRHVAVATLGTIGAGLFVSLLN